MNKKEAILAMLDGKKVRRPGFGLEDYLFYDVGAGLFKHSEGFIKNINYINTSGWEIYEPPKQKVKMWQWVVRMTKGGNPILTEEFYKTPEDIDFRTEEIIQRADWTEIEVQE